MVAVQQACELLVLSFCYFIPRKFESRWGARTVFWCSSDCWSTKLHLNTSGQSEQTQRIRANQSLMIFATSAKRRKTRLSQVRVVLGLFLIGWICFWLFWLVRARCTWFWANYRAARETPILIFDIQSKIAQKGRATAVLILKTFFPWSVLLKGFSFRCFSTGPKV